MISTLRTTTETRAGFRAAAPRLWRAATGLGLDGDVASKDVKHIRIANAIAMFAIGTVVLGAPAFLRVPGLDRAQLVAQLVSWALQISIFAAVLLLNRLKLFFTARLLLYTFLLVVVVFATFAGPGGWHYLALVFAVSTYAVFPIRQWLAILVLSASFVSVFIAVEVGVVFSFPPELEYPFAGLSADQWTRARTANLFASGVLLVIIGLYSGGVVARTEQIIQRERERSDGLLHQVLPAEIVRRLKSGEVRIADHLADVSILFADVVGFTDMSANRSAQEIVTTLDELFREFDGLARRLGLEKIKTIGDSYMAAAGAPIGTDDHRNRVVEMAFAMNSVVGSNRNFDGVRLRIGLNSGPIVAGVIGEQKFLYDLWGDAVNVASRMESHGVPGEIQTTREFADAIKDDYAVESRGQVEIKGKGPLEVFLVRREEPQRV